ncbi:MAG TPA: hypothetical protein DDY70_03800 [Clostridiales bacterium]|nr:hypothetical protein [Clostridiales bacterium]
MDLYTAVVLITAAMLAVAVIDIQSNRVIGAHMKRNSTITCILIALSAFFEWVSVMTNGAALTLIPVHKAAKLLEFCIAPLIGVMATASYSKIRRPLLIAVLSVCHMLFETIALPFGLVISIGEDNIYHRGPLYPLYILIFSLSVIFCVVSMVRSELRHYLRPSLVLSAILALLILGVGIQMVYSDVRVDYLCVAVCNYFLYNHRCKIILQLDGLTYLLNRRCFEKDLEKVTPPAVFLLMDINDFKGLNDTFGHAAGDYYLKEIAEMLRSVYGRSGTCYRYGGDEFCVILKKNTDRVKEFNAAMERKVRTRQAADGKFPGVSIGYARYDSRNLRIAEMLKNADEMMYQIKKENKKP